MEDHTIQSLLKVRKLKYSSHIYFMNKVSRRETSRSKEQANSCTLSNISTFISNVPGSEPNIYRASKVLSSYLIVIINASENNT